MNNKEKSLATGIENEVNDNDLDVMELQLGECQALINENINLKKELEKKEKHIEELKTLLDYISDNTYYRTKVINEMLENMRDHIIYQCTECPVVTE